MSLVVLMTATLAVIIPFPAPAVDHFLPPTDFGDPTVLARVAARVDVPGYERTKFGQGWGYARDDGFSGCTAREAALRSQSSGADGCTATGMMFDPYSLEEVDLSNTKVEVDHVFPLSAAWDMGAFAWTQRQRQEFANDPLNLVVTARPINQDKSDQLPSTWLPPARRARCIYAQQLATVAQRYHLALSSDDVRAMHRACWFPILRTWLLG